MDQPAWVFVACRESWASVRKSHLDAHVVEQRMPSQLKHIYKALESQHSALVESFGEGLEFCLHGVALVSPGPVFDGHISRGWSDVSLQIRKALDSICCMFTKLGAFLFGNLSLLSHRPTCRNVIRKRKDYMVGGMWSMWGH